MTLVEHKQARPGARRQRPAADSPDEPAPNRAAPLRVLHVIDSISPVYGGPTEGLWRTVQALSLCGIESVVATTDDDGPDRRTPGPYDRFIEVNGFHVRHFKTETDFYSVSLSMMRWLWSHVQRFDVVHINALFSFAPVIAAYCARRRGVPYIISPHGVLGVWGRTQARPWLKRASIRWVEAPLIRHARCLQFQSHRERDEFAELGIDVPTEVIPFAMSQGASAVDAAFTPPASVADIGDRPAILFLARIHPIKALDLLLRAFAGVIDRHPQAVLLVAGDGEAKFVSGLRQLAVELGIDSHIRWVGFVGGDLKTWLFERAQVFVLPSWSENFGVVVAEAMAAGVPVVVTQRVGIADIVADSGCGVVTECTAPSLQQAISSLLIDGTARTRMGAAGRTAVRDQLSIDTYAQRLNRMYLKASGRNA